MWLTKLFLNKMSLTATALAVLMASMSYAVAEDEKAPDYTKMSSEELVEYLVFKGGGFVLDQDTQEGGKSIRRMEQDELQKACSELKGGPVTTEIAARVAGPARESIKYPEGGIKLGDWKKGAQVADSGFGFRLREKPDDHSSRSPGGNCYACHQMDPKQIAFGTLGPSLTGFGKTRGTSEPMLKYTYDVIYNPHSFFVCTHMPRFGASGFLTQEQIQDVMAYLLDPESPVNQ